MRFSRGFIALLIFRCSISSTASISRSILILAQPAQLLSACRSHLPRTVGCLMFKLVKMQSSHLLHRQKLIALSGSEAFAGSRSLLSTALARRLKLPHQPKCSFRSGGRGREGESRVSSAFRNPSESRSSWTSYTGSRVMKSGEDHSSEEEDALKVSTYFDPPEGKITTRPAVEESDAERRYQVEESFGVEGSVEKKTSGIAKGRLTADSKKIEATSFSSVVTRRKSGKVKTSWVCENCCEVYGQWWGICTSCNAMNSIKKLIEYEASTVRGSEITEDVVRPWLSQHSRMSAPLSLADINLGPKQAKWRIPLSGQFGMEVSSVLGGGVVPGSLILIGGDPGVGKSTLLLQIAALLAQGLNFKGPAPVLYVSGEESIEQIGNRADRMTITSKELFLYSSTDVEDILEKVHNLSPQALIVDSIQTVYLRGVNGSAGNITQVKECTSAFMRFAKQTNIPVFLIGHVTKSGDIAGPRILEHMVDVVLYMEGERYSSYRLLRSVKNRFGSTDELGVFEMSESGLQAVSDPSEIFLSENFFSDSEVLVGLAVTVVIDGSRTFLLEIQALCVSDTLVTRHINGIETSRADMIISVLMKQAGLKLRDNVIFLNVVSGFKLAETAGDLAIVAAICSSFFEFPIPNNVVFIGEVGLGGELRTVPRMDKRVLAATKLGFKRCIIPKAAEKSLKALKLEMAIVGCKNLNEVINTVFSSGHAEIVSSAPVD